jgi:hypothetical protein
LVAPLIVAASILGGFVHLHLPARLLAAGPCTVILRNQSSRGELERRQFVISKMA